MGLIWALTIVVYISYITLTILLQKVNTRNCAHLFSESEVAIIILKATSTCNVRSSTAAKATKVDLAAPDL